jgi:hypothetical protein
MVRALVLAFVVGACGCEATSHPLDAGRDAPRLDGALDAPREDAARADTPLDVPVDGPCSVHCDHETTRASGLVRVDGAVHDIDHATVHVSYAFAVYFRVALSRSPACGAPETFTTIDLVVGGSPDPEPRIGRNDAMIRFRDGTMQPATMDVTVNEPVLTGEAGGRFAAHLTATGPRAFFDLDVDVSRCRHEDSL